MRVYICANHEAASPDWDDASGDRTGINLAAEAAFEAAYEAGVDFDKIHFESSFRAWNGGYLHGRFRVAVFPDTGEACDAVYLKVRAAYDEALAEWERGEAEAAFELAWEEGRARLADGDFPEREINMMADIARFLS